MLVKSVFCYEQSKTLKQAHILIGCDINRYLGAQTFTTDKPIVRLAFPPAATADQKEVSGNVCGHSCFVCRQNICPRNIDHSRSPFIKEGIALRGCGPRRRCQLILIRKLGFSPAIAEDRCRQRPGILRAFCAVIPSVFKQRFAL